MADEFQNRTDIDRLYDLIYDRESDSLKLTTKTEFNQLLEKFGFNQPNKDKFNHAIVTRETEDYWILNNAKYDYTTSQFKKVDMETSSQAIQITPSAIHIYTNPKSTDVEFDTSTYDYTEYLNNQVIGAIRISDNTFVEFDISCGWTTSFILNTDEEIETTGKGLKIKGNPSSRLANCRYTDPTSDRQYGYLALLYNADFSTETDWECDDNSTYSWLVGIHAPVVDGELDLNNADFRVMYNDTTVNPNDIHELDITKWHTILKANGTSIQAMVNGSLTTLGEGGGGGTPTITVIDDVIDGNMNAVTSNAVYDALTLKSNKADIQNNLSSTDTDKPLSANQGRLLSEGKIDKISGSTDLMLGSGSTISRNTYSTSGHKHDSDYAPLIHNHDASYSAINHNHDSSYSAINHNHDNDYAQKVHEHSNYANLVHLHGLIDSDGDLRTSPSSYHTQANKFVVTDANGHITGKDLVNYIDSVTINETQNAPSVKAICDYIGGAGGIHPLQYAEMISVQAIQYDSNREVGVYPDHPYANLYGYYKNIIGTESEQSPTQSVQWFIERITDKFTLLDGDLNDINGQISDIGTELDGKADINHTHGWVDVPLNEGTREWATLKVNEDIQMAQLTYIREWDLTGSSTTHISNIGIPVEYQPSAYVINFILPNVRVLLVDKTHVSAGRFLVQRYNGYSGSTSINVTLTWHY